MTSYYERDYRKRRLFEASEVTDEHFRFLYRTDTEGCSLRPVSWYYSSPRECPLNPSCLVGFIKPEKEPDQKERVRRDAEIVRHSVGDDPRPFVRKPGVLFAGLVNLGSSCYANSLLQVLFANKVFRRAVYEWKPAEAPSSAEELEKDKKRNVLMMELQSLFGELQVTRRSSVNPSQFVAATGIKLGIQQDAAEFHKLLLQLVEDRFEKGAHRDLRKVFREMFDGAQRYETVCKSCSAVTTSEDNLEIKLPLGQSSTAAAATATATGDDDLEKLVETFMRPSLISDRECDKCKKKSDAERKPTITRFPNVLVVELLRFAFDPATKTNHKVVRPVSFPTDLSLGRFADARARAPGSDFTLAAVVCHIGQSANSGHYTSYVLAGESWWRFDDTVVRRCDAVPFSKGSVQQFNIPSGFDCETSFAYDIDRPYAATSAASSEVTRDATEMAETPYILFYKRANAPDISTVAPPPFAEKFRQESEALAAAAEAYAEKERVKLDELRAHRQQIEEIIPGIAVGPRDTDYYWINAAWLKGFADSPFDAKPIDNSALVCEHGCVAFGKKKILMMKRISGSVWKLLHEKFGGGPVLSSDKECKECVLAWMEKHKKLAKSQDEKRRLDSMVRTYTYMDTYWVSGTWADRWMKMKGVPDVVENPTKAITCEHGRLISDNSKRERVTKEMWAWIKAHCKDEPLVEWKCDHDTPCSECLAKVEAAREHQYDMDVAKRELRNALYMRPAWIKDIRSGVVYHLVPEQWIKALETYLDPFLRGISEPGKPDTKALLCEHGKLPYNVLEDALIVTGKVRRLALIQKPAWEQITAVFGSFGPGVTFTCVENKNLWGEERLSAIEGFTEPEQCKECVQKQLAKEEAERLDFKDKRITVEEDTLSVWSKKRADLVVSSTTTIGELRLMLFESMDIEPACQKLTYNKRVLERDKLTLREYGVPHSSTILISRAAQGEHIIIAEYDVADDTTPPAGGRAGQPAAKQQAFEGTTFEGTSLAKPRPVSTAAPGKAAPAQPAPAPPSPSPTKPAPAPEPVPKVEPKPTGKTCTRCTYLNKLTATRCEMCDNIL